MTRPRKRRVPMEGMIESALQPRRFVGWNEGFSFVSDLSRVEREIAKLVASEPGERSRCTKPSSQPVTRRQRKSTTRMANSGRSPATFIAAGLWRDKRLMRIAARAVVGWAGQKSNARSFESPYYQAARIARTRLAICCLARRRSMPAASIASYSVY